MPRNQVIALEYELTGQGEPLVLVHGSWSDRDNWLPVIPGLARSRSVLAYSRRGHGFSGRDLEATRYDHEEDLASLIERMNVGPVTVVGTSYGGSIALGLAARRPDLVRDLVVHEPPLVELVAADSRAQAELAVVGPAIVDVVARIERGDAEGAAHQFVDRVAFQPGAWEALPAELRATMIDSAPAFLAEQRDPDWAALEATGVTSPVLLTQGDQSPEWFRLVIARLADAIPQASVRTFAGAGHAPHLTHPEEFVSTVEGFLAGAVDERLAA